MLTFIVNLFLPTLQGTKIAFLKAVLSGQKDAVKRDQIPNYKVPNYPELSVVKNRAVMKRHTGDSC